MTLEPTPILPIANVDHVLDGVKRLIAEFEAFVNEQAEQGQEVSWPSGLMIAHNLFKRVVTDLAERQGLDEAGKAKFYAMTLRRLSQSLLSPEESRAAEDAVLREMGMP